MQQHASSVQSERKRMRPRAENVKKAGGINTARLGAKDRGIVFKESCWWVRLYVNGREKWYRADNKSQAKALYGRLKADQREGKYFDKPRSVPFKELAKDYQMAVDARRRRVGDDHARLAR